MFKRKKKENKKIEEKNEIESKKDCIYQLLDDKIIICEIDLDKNFTYLNKNFQNSFNYGKKELIGENFTKIIHEDIPSCLLDRAFLTASQGDSSHPGVWEGLIKTKNKNNDKCFWNNVFIQGIYKKDILIGFSILKRETNKDKIASISEIYQEIKKTGKSKNFC